MNALFLLGGLLLILGGANYLTDGSAALAARFRVPEFLIGLTVVAVGTSTPELVVSVLSAVRGQGDMAVGNVVGSNLFNGFVILGVCALVRPLLLSGDRIRRDIPFGVVASLLLLAVVAGARFASGGAGRISRIEGLVMMALYAGWIVWTIRRTSRPPRRDEAAVGVKPGWTIALMIGGGLAALLGGGELFLRGATQIARAWGVSESVIAITLVAGGTSLPELASSVAAVAKGRPEIALGNVIGSNTANILLVLGLSATVSPLAPGGITTVDAGIVLLSAVLLWMTAYTFRRRCVDRWEGVLFLAIYAVYVERLIAA